MDSSRLREYAELLAKKGVSVLPGEEVWINAQLDQPEFVRLVVEECYKAGAKKVRVRFSDNKISKLSYQYMTLKELSKVAEYTLSEYRYMKKNKPSMYLEISQEKLFQVNGQKGKNVAFQFRFQSGLGKKSFTKK